MRKPLVTIVTPSFNQGRFIRQTIESVLEQDYPHVEYIIMDGGSTDETAQVVSQYDGRLRWISEPDRGQSHAINKGFRMARGELVAWLNSDDLLLPGAVGHAVAAYERNPALGAVYGDGYLIDREGAITQKFPHTQEMNLWRLVHLSDFILQQTVFFRKDVFAEIGYINENLTYTMDWDVLIRIAKRYPVEYIKELMAALREHAEAKSSSGGLARVKEIREMLRSHTGMRVPPGYLVYGLDTYQGVWCDWVTQHAPGRVGERLARLIRTVCSTYIGKVIVEAQGWYPDRWAGPRVHYMAAPGRGALQISGNLPDMGGPLDGQVLEVRQKGRRLARQPLEPGKFCFVVEPGGPPDDVVHLELRASRFMIPEPVLGGAERRRISYFLEDIRRT